MKKPTPEVSGSELTLVTPFCSSFFVFGFCEGVGGHPGGLVYGAISLQLNLRQAVFSS